MRFDGLEQKSQLPTVAQGKRIAPQHWLRSKISYKVGAAFVVLATLTGVNVFVGHKFIDETNGTAEAVNVAGRLRMLSQKLAFEAAKAIRDPTTDKSEALKAMQAFDRTLEVLIAGGIAFDYRIKASSPNVADLVQLTTQDWRDYRMHIEHALHFKGSVSDGNAMIARLSNGSAAMLSRTDAIVHSLTAQAQDIQRKQMLTGYAVLVVDIFILLSMYFYTRRRIINPLRRLASHSRQLAAGDFSARSAIDSNDELGQLARAVNFSAEMLGNLVDRMIEEQQSVKKAEYMFRGLAENSMVGVYIVQDERFVFVNPRMAEMFGYQRDEMIEKVGLYELVSDDDYELVQRNRERRIRGEVDRVVYRRRARRRDGTMFDVEVFGSVMHLGSMPATIGIIHDITERKRAEQTSGLLSACNQALVRATSEEALLAAVSHQMRQRCGYPFVWVGYPSEDPHFPVQVMAFDEDQKGTLLKMMNKVRQTAGNLHDEPAAVAIRTGVRVSVQNPGRHKGSDPWTEFTELYNIASVVAIPLRAGDDVIGALTVYSHLTEAMNEKELPIIEELAGNLAYGIRALRARKSQELYAKQLEHNANHDALTGLANRNLLSDRLRQSFASANRYGHSVAVLLLDLDDFKIINDSLGHAAGDMLLQKLAHRLQEAVRDSDTVARLGGDEFVIVMPMIASASDCEVVAKKVLRVLGEPFMIGGHKTHVRCSIGISLYPQDGKNEERMLKNVDLAMYKAKSESGNTYRFFKNEMDMANRERQVLETRLHEALKQKEFLLHYQPKIDARTGRISGAEALIRWNHPEAGMISPDKFIPIAEESTLIVPLGEWVLWEACRQSKAWEDGSDEPLTISVNLSARQIHLDDVVGLTQRILNRTGMDPHALDLEITETALMHDPGRAATVLSRLAALGVRLSLDDFGTGYSSLNYLRKFPLSTIKIDKTFVSGMTINNQDATIVRSIIRLAHDLGMTVVAEGVETREQADYLGEHACDEMQGYYFSKPLPARAFVSYRAEHLRQQT